MSGGNIIVSFTNSNLRGLKHGMNQSPEKIDSLERQRIKDLKKKMRKNFDSAKKLAESDVRHYSQVIRVTQQPLSCLPEIDTRKQSSEMPSVLQSLKRSRIGQLISEELRNYDPGFNKEEYLMGSRMGAAFLSPQATSRPLIDRNSSQIMRDCQIDDPTRVQSPTFEEPLQPKHQYGEIVN